MFCSIDRILNKTKKHFKIISAKHNEKLKKEALTILMEGLSGAEDYMLSQRYDYNTVLYQTSKNNPIKVQAGLETKLSIKPEIPATAKVKVVDDLTGEPIQYAMIAGKVTLQDGKEKVIYAMTGANGYGEAAGVDSYFSKNLLRGSKIQLTVSHMPATNDISDWYAGMQGEETISSLEDYEIIIRLKKIEIVTLEGTVTDSKGAPMRNIYISTPHPTGAFYCNSNKDGKYRMELPKMSGNIEISYYERNCGTEKKTLTLANGKNILDVQMPVSAKAKLAVSLNTISVSGATTEMSMNPRLISRMNINVKNIRTGRMAQSFQESTGLFDIEGKPGDTIEITADGIEDGYSKSIATVVLDKHNYAEATLDLKEYGRIKAYVTDEHGNMRADKGRYLYIYNSVDGRYVGLGSSYAPNIASTSVPAGNYRAVISWENIYQQHISGWENAPRSIITPFVFSGQSVSDTFCFL